MTQGFYEQLGVEPSADHDQLRAAYAQAVASLTKRRKLLIEQGGDAGQLDLARAQLDEAWDVLSDPTRRRRYDAMRVLTADGPPDPRRLWDQAAGALIPPSAAAAVDLLRVATNLKTGALPPAPTFATTKAASPELEATVHATSPTMVPSTSDEETIPRIQATPRKPAPVVQLPTATDNAQEPSLRVVDGSPTASSVLVLDPTPTPAAPQKPVVPPEQVARFIEQHGYSGALLQAVRDARDIALQDMADTTRISVRYLEAIEADDFGALPSATFVRGYVREMARMLMLDEGSVVQGYMSRLS